jgi:hypothetical protein
MVQARWATGHGAVRFEVRGSRFEVRGSRFEVRGSRFGQIIDLVLPDDTTRNGSIDRHLKEERAEARGNSSPRSSTLGPGP